MPDYSKRSVSFTAKGYRWPPASLDERDALACQFQREEMEEYLRSEAGEK